MADRDETLPSVPTSPSGKMTEPPIKYEWAIFGLDNVKARLDSFWEIEFADDEVVSSLDLALKESRYEDLKREFLMWQERLILSISILADDKAVMQSHSPTINTCQATLDKCLRAILRVKRSLQQHSSSSSATSAPPKVQRMKLERVKIPTFSGDFTSWEEFHDLFVSGVHKDESIDGAAKMAYLKMFLSGEAASVIGNCKSTDAGYANAWQTLVDRYSNPREIVFCHLRKFDNLSQCQDEASDIRKITDTLNELVRSLSSLKVPVQHWDVILVFLAMRKMDIVTKKEWLLSQDNALPVFSEFIKFLETRARALADATPKKAKPGASSKSAHSATTSISDQKCVCCGGSHLLYQCDVFKQRPSKERESIIRKNKMCFNCFSKKHSVQKCESKFKCRTCQEKHHTLLHPDSQQQSSATSAPVVVSAPNPTAPQSTTVATASGTTAKQRSSSSHCSFGPIASNHVLLETASVYAVNSRGELETVRMFVDKGSEAEFISEACVDQLGLTSYGPTTKVTGIGGHACGSTKGKVKLTLFSKFNNFSLPICAEVVDKVTRGHLPQCHAKSSFPHLQGLNLADPEYFRPQNVDILLGAKFASLIKLGGLVHGPPGTPSAEETHFGWLLSGSIPSRRGDTTTHSAAVTSSHVSPITTITKDSPSTSALTSISSAREDSSLDKILQRHWEMEEAEPTTLPRTQEDSICESIYQTTTSRDSNGRYVVDLPFKENRPSLGGSLVVATNRFKSVEKRLQKNPSIQEEYRRYFQDHLKSGVLEVVPAQEINCKSSECYYMPYHEVVKDSSTTTKVRIVFDCSAKTVNGPSLNEVMYAGPKLQVDLIPLLIRFRTYPYALSADINKFFNQISVNKRHRDYQRLVFREAPEAVLQHYRMTRVTFGVTAAPYLATRTLHQLFDDECEDPRVTEAVKCETLVDNILTGPFSIADALHIQSTLIDTMTKGQLVLRKWASNVPELLEPIPIDLREVNLPLTISETPQLPTCGLKWNPANDSFQMSIPRFEPSSNPTKRSVLSQIAKIYDPLGWLSPVTIKSKILMQDLWKLKLSWDEPLPASMAKKWTSIETEVPLLAKFQVPRCYLSDLAPELVTTRNLTYQLHGFSDASNQAYAAVVYLRAQDSASGESTVSIVGAKTKVAPVTGDTTPRLELNGARLLSTLKTVLQALPIDVSSVSCYTDSTSVLGWLTSNSQEKTDVYTNNRVRTIRAKIPSATWHHVSGSENPADCASRGVSAKCFLTHPLWTTGPKWLITTNHETTTQVYSANHAPPVPNTILDLVNNCSSFVRMKRVVAYVLRFVSNLKSTKPPRLRGPLSASELESALLVIVRAVQQSEFSEEIAKLRGLKSKTPKKLKFLTPFLDQGGLLRVGGRLSRAELSHEQKHPLLLPKNHHFSIVIARYFHREHHHAGPSLLLCLIREKFWIGGGPSLAKRTVRACVTCHRHKPRPLDQIMSDLPEARVTKSRPFAHTAMDFAGPFMLCVTPGRKPRLTKSYFCVFVCMAVKAVHLELVGDLSTPSFIAALKRFVSRRGRPQALYSDGGRNFVGAKNELDRIVKFLHSTDLQKILNEYCAELGIEFNFNPPLSPHHGGLFEAAVKSTKHHLTRIIGDRHLSHEEFQTLLCQVEAALNSRPLTPMSSDPSDYAALTPAHFLVGDALHSIPQEDLTKVKEGRLSRWEASQQVFQHFWKRFQTEYLQALMSRSKWTQLQPNLSPGTMVLVKESDADFAGHKWNLARVTRVFPDAYGNVRIAEIKTPSGSLFQRPIVKIAPLPIEQ